MLNKTEVENVKNIAKAEIENALLDELGEEGNEIGVLSETDLDDEINQEVQFDVFEDIINTRIKKGERVTYDILVDNIQVATGLSKLSSWKEVHKLYAPQGGFVHVKSRNSKGKWLRKQGITLGEYKSSIDDDETVGDKDQGFTAKDFMQMQARSEDRMEMMLKRTREEAKNSADEKVGLITALMGNKNDGGGTELLMMMMKQQSDQAEIMRQENIRQEDLRRLEKKEADERFEKLLLTISSKDNESDPVAEILRLQEAETRGYDKAMKFNEILEEKAESRALQLADQNKEESMTDKALGVILKTLPQVTGMIANKASAHNESATPVREISPQVAQANPLGMETLTSNNQKVETSQNVDTINKEQDLAKKRQEQINNARKVILDLTLGEIASDLLAETKPSETSDKVIKILSDNSIDPSLVCRLFTYEDFVKLAEDNSLLAMAEENGKKNELLNWLKEFYTDVHEKTSAPQPRQSV